MSFSTAKKKCLKLLVNKDEVIEENAEIEHLLNFEEKKIRKDDKSMVDLFLRCQKNLKNFICRVKNLDANLKTSAEIFKSDSNSTNSKSHNENLFLIEEKTEEEQF